MSVVVNAPVGSFFVTHVSHLIGGGCCRITETPEELMTFLLTV
jgi:hypothetical protein